MQENGKFKGSHAPQNEFRIFLRNLLLFNATNTNKVLLKRKGDYWSWDSLFFLIPHFCRKNQSPLRKIHCQRPSVSVEREFVFFKRKLPVPLDLFLLTFMKG